MSSPFAMDQSEKVGLGAALGGHALLLALLVFGLWKAAVPMGSDGGGGGSEGIAVSIISESAAAAPAAGEIENEPIPEVQEVAEVLPEAEPEQIAVKKPDQKVVQKVVQKQSPVRKLVPPSKDKGKSKSRNTSDFDQRMKEALDKTGGGGGGRVPDPGSSGGGGGGNTANVAQEVKTARATISKQIRIGNCIPTGVDVNKVITKVTVKLASNGKLMAITNVSQSGRTASNSAQFEPIKRCIVDSVKKVDRFTGLDPATHSSWELISVPFASKG
jgi:periplasmic protein TonB